MWVSTFFILLSSSINYDRRLYLANKQIKDLKKGDVIRASVSDGRKAYLSWCKITELYKVTVYDPNINGKSTPSGRKELYALQYAAEDGFLKGSAYGPYYFEEQDIFLIPDRPPKWKRILKELFSS